MGVRRHIPQITAAVASKLLQHVWQTDEELRRGHTGGPDGRSDRQCDPSFSEEEETAEQNSCVAVQPAMP